MNFILEKSDTSDSHLSRFRVRNSVGDVVGHVAVPPAQEVDLQRHWVASAPAPRATAPRATAGGKPNPVVAAIVAHKQQSAPSRAAVGNKENAAVAAMLKAAKKQGSLPREAILRGCA